MHVVCFLSSHTHTHTDAPPPPTLQALSVAPSSLLALKLIGFPSPLTSHHSLHSETLAQVSSCSGVVKKPSAPLITRRRSLSKYSSRVLIADTPVGPENRPRGCTRHNNTHSMRTTKYDDNSVIFYTSSFCAFKILFFYGKKRKLCVLVVIIIVAFLVEWAHFLCTRRIKPVQQ